MLILIIWQIHFKKLKCLYTTTLITIWAVSHFSDWIQYSTFKNRMLVSVNRFSCKRWFNVRFEIEESGVNSNSRYIFLTLSVEINEMINETCVERAWESMSHHIIKRVCNSRHLFSYSINSIQLTIWLSRTIKINPLDFLYLFCKSMNWFLYDKAFDMKKLNRIITFIIISFSTARTYVYIEGYIYNFKEYLCKI